MIKIAPYKSTEEAIKSLDNGGRFYNVLTKADDNIISKEEIGKVGGLFRDKQKIVLFLELSISDLSENEKDSILSKLDLEMTFHYQAYKAQYLLPSEADAKGKISSNTVITGIPKQVDSKEDFKGFIMIPIMVGQVMTFSMIPLIDHYDVYEVRDEQSDDYFLIAHTKGKVQLPNEKIQIAGVLKELKDNKEDKKASKKFLEAVYWM